MKMFFRLMLVVVLGVIAAVLDMTLWNAWRSGRSGQRLHAFAPPTVRR
jgi:hypothetical protein